ncbi:MAG: hypothetical protein MdMp014T_0302 [Treponematales bacterium]
MKRFFGVFFVFALILSPVAAQDTDAEASSRDVVAVEDAGQEKEAPKVEAGAKQAPAKAAPVVVYITRTGKKYHRENCRYLRQSKIETTLEEARRSYEPCSVCNPPR